MGNKGQHKVAHDWKDAHNRIESTLKVAEVKENAVL
jgi:hypothetical protein